MFLGRVVGEVWATKKAPDLEGKRLLVIEPLDENRDRAADMVKPVVAADPLGADYGERVVVAFGKAARVACGGDGDFAFEAAVVGIVDDFNVPTANESWRREPGSGPRRRTARTACWSPMRCTSSDASISIVETDRGPARRCSRRWPAMARTWIRPWRRPRSRRSWD